MPRELEYKPLLIQRRFVTRSVIKTLWTYLSVSMEKFLTIIRLSYLRESCSRLGCIGQWFYRILLNKNGHRHKEGEFADEPLTDVETATIYRRNDPNANPVLKGHKEAGFPKGWPSRFDTQFKLMKVLGFVYYEWGKRIEFSQTGNYLADTVSISINEGVISRRNCKSS